MTCSRANVTFLPSSGKDVSVKKSVWQVEYKINKNVKQSRYRPGVAQRVPES